MIAKAPACRARPLRHSRLASGLLLGAVLPLLPACGSFDRLSSEEALIETVPAKGHPIAFVERDEAMDIELPPHHQGLGRNQYIDAYRFGIRYKEEATGPLYLSVPGNRHDAHLWQPAVVDIRRALTAAGVDPNRVKRAASANSAVITLGYQRPQAVAPQCGHWHRDVGRERERVNYPDFGCTTQRNLANMVVNSRDLMAPQDESQASSERRSRTWSKYVVGDSASATSTAAPESTDAKPKAGKK